MSIALRGTLGLLWAAAGAAIFPIMPAYSQPSQKTVKIYAGYVIVSSEAQAGPAFIVRRAAFRRTYEWHKGEIELETWQEGAPKADYKFRFIPDQKTIEYKMQGKDASGFLRIESGAEGADGVPSGFVFKLTSHSSESFVGKELAKEHRVSGAGIAESHGMKVNVAYEMPECTEEEFKKTVDFVERTREVNFEKPATQALEALRKDYPLDLVQCAFRTGSDAYRLVQVEKFDERMVALRLVASAAGKPMIDANLVLNRVGDKRIYKSAANGPFESVVLDLSDSKRELLSWKGVFKGARGGDSWTEIFSAGKKDCSVKISGAAKTLNGARLREEEFSLATYMALGKDKLQSYMDEKASAMGSKNFFCAGKYHDALGGAGMKQSALFGARVVLSRASAIYVLMPYRDFNYEIRSYLATANPAIFWAQLGARRIRVSDGFGWDKPEIEFKLEADVTEYWATYVGKVKIGEKGCSATISEYKAGKETGRFVYEGKAVDAAVYRTALHDAVTRHLKQ